MTFADIQRLLMPIKRKIFLMIGRGIVEAINNSEKTQKIQITGLNNETITDIERVQNYGFESYPSASTNTEAVIVFGNGNRDQGISICVQNREYRPTDLSVDDVCVYDKSDNRVWLKDGDTLKISGSGLKIEMLAANEAYVKGDTFKTELDKDIDAMTTLQAGINAWVPVPNDGGAALKTALATFLAKPMASSANILSTKIKGE
jgi:phage baseplate assembly protein V